MPQVALIVCSLGLFPLRRGGTLGFSSEMLTSPQCTCKHYSNTFYLLLLNLSARAQQVGCAANKQ